MNYRGKDKAGPAVTGRILVKNTLWNISGQAMPMLVAFVSMPILIQGLGIERFGVLTLAWMVVGYFTLFDMGIGRATTKFVAEYIARREFDVLPKMIWTSVIVLIGFGTIGGGAIVVLTHWLVHHALKVPADLINETEKTLYVLAASVPFVLAATGVRGALEAQQKFGLVNAVKIPASTLTFIAPVVVLPLTKSLYHIVALLAIGRVLVFFVYLYYCITLLPALKHISLPTSERFKELIRYGGWLTVSNVVGPFMTYLDRFVVGSLISLSAVAYYATPYDFVTRLWVISGSLLGVLFPVFSSYSIIDQERMSQLFDQAVKYLFVILTPMILALMILAQPFLNLWLGAAFSTSSTLVLQLLSAGVLICALAQVPFSALQAMGRPDITAKIHAFELPLYGVMIWILAHKFGINGVALAWLLRIVIDAVLLFGFYYHIKRETNLLALRLLIPIVRAIIGILIFVFLATKLPGILAKGSIFLVSVILFAIYSWKYLLQSEKSALRAFMNKVYSINK